jgi:hypothetical protein
MAKRQYGYNEATARFQEAIRLYEVVGDTRGKAHCIWDQR